MSAATTNGDAQTAGNRPVAKGGQSKEEQLIALYMELNGVSESEARGVYEHLEMAQGLPATAPVVPKE